MDNSYDTDDTGGAVRNGGRRSSSPYIVSRRRTDHTFAGDPPEATATADAPSPSADFDDEDELAEEEDNDDNEGEEEEDEEEEEEEEEDGRTVTNGSQEGDASSTNNNATESSTNNDTNASISAVSDLKSLQGLRELGPEAVCWQLSSAKPGNGVEQIRDPSLDTYWQSDGQTQPHWIQVHFARRVAISHVCLYLDYTLDESYTPKKISVDAGMTHQDLQQAVPETDLTEPSGWVIFPLRSPPDPLDDLDDVNFTTSNNEGEAHDKDPDRIQDIYNNKNMVRAHLVRISIQAMHQNGRDTHVRQVRLYGPRLMGGLHHHNHHHYHEFGAFSGSSGVDELPALSPAAADDSSSSSFRGQHHKTAHNNAVMMEDPWSRSGVDSIHATRFTTIR